MKRIALLLLASFLSTSIVVQPMERPRPEIIEIEDEPDAKKLAITEILLSQMPDDIWRHIFFFTITEIDNKAPWKFLEWIHSLRETCTQFKRSMPNEETIAIWMNIPVMNVYAAKGNWVNIVELATDHQHRPDRCIFYNDKFKFKPLDYAAGVGHGTRKDILGNNKDLRLKAVIGLRKESAITVDQANLFLNINEYGITCCLTTHDTKSFQEALDQSLLLGGNINCSSEKGKLLISYVARANDLEKLKFLLKEAAKIKGIDIVNVKDGFYGGTALRHAANGGSIECIKLLLDNGSDANAQDNNEVTALHVVSGKGHHKCVQALLNVEGIDINAKSNGGFTALHYAASNDHLTCVQLLLDNGIDATAKDSNGRTALDHAIFYDHSECVAEISKQA